MHAQRGAFDDITKFFLGMRQIFFGLVTVRDVYSGAHDMSATINGQRRAGNVDANQRTILFPDIGFKFRISVLKNQRHYFFKEAGSRFLKEILTVHPGNIHRIKAG